MISSEKMDEKSNEKVENKILEAGESRKVKAGDLLWCKMGKYPFWPCMVSYDPARNNYIKVVRLNDKTHVFYHVQYFGPKPQRSWTSSKNTFYYEGMTKFFAKRDALSNGKKSARSAFYIPSNHKESWEVAVNEAEEALEVNDVNQRHRKYVFSYENVKKKCLLKGIHGVPERISEILEINQEKTEGKAPPVKKMKYSTSLVSMKQLCYMCMKAESEFTCSSCLKAFHVECVGIISIPSDFKCSDCVSISKTCFACKKSDGLLAKCEQNQCSKYYHLTCWESFKFMKQKKNICPLHVCSTCFKENPRNPTASKGLMVTCSDCPTAFHSRESCIPAGSVEIASRQIKCSFHFLGKNLLSKHKPCNITYCRVCDTGGTLICCEACPNAYHVACLKSDVPEGEYFCEECRGKKHYYYNMIVWCKLGKHRWWPSIIKHPSDVPEAVQRVKHCHGEFPVYFLGSNNFYWSHRCRVIPYEEKHHGFKSQSGSKQFKKGLDLAAIKYHEYQMMRLSASLCGEKPDQYKHIKVNRNSSRVKNMTSERTVNPCRCTPDSKDPCGTDTCLNRSILIECERKHCPTGDKCQNQRFQKRLYKRIKIIKTEGRGWGLAADENIKKEDFIIEYVGEVISLEEYHERSSELQRKEEKNYYFMYLDSRRIIDAGLMGNHARFINHSCNPNCELSKWSVNNDVRIGVFAIKDIESGTELTFNYQLDKNHIQYFDQKCLCGAENCEGVIGGKSKEKSNLVNKLCVKSKGQRTLKRSRPKKISFIVKTSVEKKLLKKSLSVKNERRTELAKKSSIQKNTLKDIRILIERLPSSSADLQSYISKQCALPNVPSVIDPSPITSQNFPTSEAILSNFYPTQDTEQYVSPSHSDLETPALLFQETEGNNELCILPSTPVLIDAPHLPSSVDSLQAGEGTISDEDIKVCVLDDDMPVPVVANSKQAMNKQISTAVHRCARHYGQQSKSKPDCICFTCAVCDTVDDDGLFCAKCPTAFCNNCYFNAFIHVMRDKSNRFLCQICSIRRIRLLRKSCDL